MATNTNFIPATELPLAETESADVLCVVDGQLCRRQTGFVGSMVSGVCVIDLSKASDATFEDPTYGDRIKFALLSGVPVYIYENNKYDPILSFTFVDPNPVTITTTATTVSSTTSTVLPRIWVGLWNNSYSFAMSDEA